MINAFNLLFSNGDLMLLCLAFGSISFLVGIYVAWSEAMRYFQGVIQTYCIDCNIKKKYIELLEEEPNSNENT